MPQIAFQVAELGGRCYAVNDRGRTVAVVTSQGYVDWLLRSPLQDGPLLTALRKEAHLSYVMGLKIQLTTPHPATELRSLAWRVEDSGRRCVLTGEGASADGRFLSRTTAVLHPDAAGARYEWNMTTEIVNAGGGDVELPELEYNNVYPGEAGKGMLFAPTKQYDCTLMVDRDGVVWRFPHQHVLHYRHLIEPLRFAPGALAGFFGERSGGPVVVVRECSWAPDWAICDMYYDLHCCARSAEPLGAGRTLTFRYEIKYLNQADSEALLALSRPIPLPAEDRAAHEMARLELGMNHFDRPVLLDAPDQASGFRPEPPVKVWDRFVGHTTRGSLRITNERPAVTAWSAAPPTQIPAESVLNLTGMVRTQGVQGRGISLRVRYHTFVWHPAPHVEWPATVESIPVGGTTDGWVRIEVPELRVPPEHFDYLIWIDVLLDGQGAAWLTDVDVDLKALPQVEGEAAQGSARAAGRGRRGRALAGTSGVR